MSPGPGWLCDTATGWDQKFVVMSARCETTRHTVLCVTDPAKPCHPLASLQGP